jgi:hypothetical protein
MSDEDFFEKAGSGGLLGPEYDYTKQIKTPGDMGMSAAGNISALEKDFKGLGAYAKVLLGGGGPAQFDANKALGNKFFLPTGATCKDIETDNDVERSIYINNVPTGTFSLTVDNNMGDSGGMKGLVPGILEKLVSMNPMNIFQAFVAGSDPKCQHVVLETIDNNNISSNEGAYITTTDLEKMDACWFPIVNGVRKNPVTEKTCTVRESFTEKKKSIADMPDDTLVKIYYTSIGLLLLYMFTRVLTKKH